MPRIRIDTDALQRCSANLQTQIGMFGDFNNRLTGLIGNITSSWEGEACTAYHEMMTAYSGLASRWTGILSQYLDYIQQAQQRFETMDNQCASRIRGAF